MAWNVGKTWLDVAEATALATDYVSSYDPSTRKISHLTREWASEVSRVPVIHMMSKIRLRQAVLARHLWSVAMFSAGYSYPQIARAQLRNDHSTVIHHLHYKKIDTGFEGYLNVALVFGRDLGKRRIAYIDSGFDISHDPLRQPRARKSLQDLRRERVAELEADLAFRKGFTPVIVNDHPVFLRGLVPPDNKTMKDLAAAMEREADG